MFLPHNEGQSSGRGLYQNVVAANSTTINIGEAVMIDANGFLTNAVAGGPILGIAQGFEIPSGLGLPVAPYSPGAVTSAVTDSLVAAADNQTTAKLVVKVDTSVLSRWTVNVNGVLGTTAASQLIGAVLDVDSGAALGAGNGRLLESTADRSGGGTGNFFSWGVDPGDATRLIVSVHTSQLYN